MMMALGNTTTLGIWQGTSNHRHRCCKVIFVACLWLIMASVSGEEDWSKCPRECRCKWISGKRTAECQNNRLSALPIFPMPDKIQVLHMNGNPLSMLPDKAFVKAGLINVQKVYMSNCSLSDLHPGAFSDLVILIELDLSNNNLRSLHPGTFNGNIRIRKLWLTNNPIRSLPRNFVFPDMPHLRILDLSHGLLTRLGRTVFSKLEYLEVLHLNHNRFHRLDKRVFVPVKSLKSLTLEGNPWHCDCRLQDFWKWVMINTLFNKPTACTTPSKLKGYGWEMLTSAQLACPPVVRVPQPMVAVATGQTASLACLVNENASNQKLYWLDYNGDLIVNNSGSNTYISSDGTSQGGQRYTINTGPVFVTSYNHDRETSTFRRKNGMMNDGPIEVLASSSSSIVLTAAVSYENQILGDDKERYRDKSSRDYSFKEDGGYRADENFDTRDPFMHRAQKRRWYNLTIENVQMSGSASPVKYTCVAKNEGGVSKGNVTLVYSETVATYLDNRDISMLLVTGLIAGVMVFLAIGSAVICFVMHRKHSRRNSRHHHLPHSQGSNSYAHHQTTVTTTNKSDLTGTTALPLNGFMNSSTFNEMEESDQNHISVGNGLQKASSADVYQLQQMSSSRGSTLDYDNEGEGNKSTDRLMDIKNGRKTNASTTSSFLRSSSLQQQKGDLSSDEGSENGSNNRNKKNRKKGTNLVSQSQKGISNDQLRTASVDNLSHDRNVIQTRQASTNLIPKPSSVHDMIDEHSSTPFSKYNPNKSSSSMTGRKSTNVLPDKDLDDSGRGSVSGNSANNCEDYNNYLPDLERKYISSSNSSSNNSRFYPDILRSSSTHGITHPADLNSGSSSVGSDSTLVAVPETDEHSNPQMMGPMSQHHPHGWFDQMHHPHWQHPYLEHNNLYENYLPTHPFSQQHPSFQPLNYNYTDLDMSYKNGDNLANTQRPNNQPGLHQWTNDVASQNRAMVIDHDNHSKVNDHHNHYHPLQTVGILFNGPANERQIGAAASLVRNDAKQHQKLLRESEFNKSKTEALIAHQQNSSKINIYANSGNWKQHLDDSGLATLPRRPFSSQAFYHHPYNTNGLELSSNYNPQFMGEGFKMNLSQSPSTAMSMTALVSPSSSTNFQPTNETMKMSRQQLLQQQFGYFPTNHLVAEKHEPLSEGGSRNDNGAATKTSMKRVRLQENPRSSNIEKIHASNNAQQKSLQGAHFMATQRSLSSDPYLWSNIVTNRSSLSKPSENVPKIPDRKLMTNKKSNDSTHNKKLPMLPTLPEESFASTTTHVVQDNSKLVDNPTDDTENNEDMNGKTFLGSFSDATNELSSTTASAISLMVSNVRRTKNDFLAKELESRKELLQALVKDKNDTPV